MTESKTSETVQIHIWVKGRVQGVGFRNHVQLAGVQLGLTGWVRNVGYDTVETVAQGQRESLIEFADVVKNGPRAGRVEDARIEWETVTGEFSNFSVKYNA